MVVCRPMPPGPTTHTAASCPASAAVSAGTVYADLTTGKPAGKVEGESSRLMAVTLKPADRRAAVMGVPKLPLAWRGGGVSLGGMDDIWEQGRKLYAEDSYFLEGHGGCQCVYSSLGCLDEHEYEYA
jgi:hypothetical protein